MSTVTGSTERTFNVHYNNHAGQLRGDLCPLLLHGSTERGFSKYPPILGPFRGDLIC